MVAAAKETGLPVSGKPAQRWVSGPRMAAQKTGRPYGCPVTGQNCLIIHGLITAALVKKWTEQVSWLQIAAGRAFSGADSQWHMRFAPCYSDGFASDFHRIPFIP